MKTFFPSLFLCTALTAAGCVTPADDVAPETASDPVTLIREAYDAECLPDQIMVQKGARRVSVVIDCK